MAKAIQDIAAKTAEVVIDVGARVGLDAATSIDIAKAALQLAVYAGLSYATRPDTPDPEAGKVPLRQSMPPRVTAYGRCRLSGSYALFEAVANKSYDVIALHHGRVEAIERFFLHDDEVFPLANGTIDTDAFPDNRYGFGHVKIETRLGAVPETPYAEAVTALSASNIWTADHRGDGVASLYLRAESGKLNAFPKDFPNGLPLPSVIGRWACVYDWRDPSQDIDDPSTWKASLNPAVCLADYVTSADHGMGEPWEQRIAPRLAAWTAAANACDALVAKIGGTEKRYEVGGFFTHATAPVEVIRQLTAACDGWLCPAGDGSLIFKAGVYEAPTLTLTDDHVLDLVVDRFTPDEEAVNELVVSYTSEAHDFTTVEADPWRDEADILARGRERSAPAALPWVPRHTQARRLAKRLMSRQGAELRGQCRTNLYGLNLLGERYVRLQLSDLDCTADIVVEVTRLEFDLVRMGVVFDWVLADPNIDAWNPATEEGFAPGAPDRPAPTALAAPTISTAVGFFSGGDAAPRVRVTLPEPGRADLIYAIRWRVAGGVAWVETTAEDATPGAGVSLETGVVPADASIEVQTAYLTGSGAQSPWSAISTVSTSTAALAPAPPTDLAAAPGTGEATISWRNPTSTNLAAVRIYRGTTTTFADAVQIGTDRPAALGALDDVTHAGLTAGTTYRWWITAVSASGVESAPAGPVSATPT